MSGISGISTNDTNLLYLLAQAADQNGDQSVADSSSVDPLLAVGSDTQDGATSTDATNANSLQEIIRQAVSSALAEAEKSGNTTDLKKVIRSAVEQALKDNGIDTNELKEQSASDSTDNQTSSQIDTKTLNMLLQIWASQDNNENPTGYFFDSGQ